MHKGAFNTNNFSHLILFTVVLSAPYHQPTLLVRAWDWHRYHFLIPVAGIWRAQEAEISIQISTLAGVRTPAVK